MTLIKLLTVAPQIGASLDWNHTTNPSQQRALQGCRAQQVVSAAHSTLLSMSVQLSPHAYLCCRFLDACAHSFLLTWFNFHPNTHHLVILPNVWSYLAIYFSTQFPGPYLSILHPSSCLGTSLCISDPPGADLCSSDIWILVFPLPDMPSVVCGKCGICYVYYKYLQNLQYSA